MKRHETSIEAEDRLMYEEVTSNYDYYMKKNYYTMLNINKIQKPRPKHKCQDETELILYESIDTIIESEYS